MRIISYGGGVQSTALCVLATQDKIGQIDAALFSNVGDDSEHPATITYVREVMIPWCAERGLPVHELKRINRQGQVVTLWTHLMRPESRSVPIPVRMSDTGAPGTRSCTADYKIAVITKWLKAHGVSKTAPASVCIGFSTDEAHRASNRRANPYELPSTDRRCGRRCAATNRHSSRSRSNLKTPLMSGGGNADAIRCISRASGNP